MDLTVLLVDDHDAFRASAKELLERAGYDVIAEAATGESALKAAEATTPAIILLDVQLPDINGFDLVDDLRRTTGARVVMISGREPSAFKARLSRSRAVDFIYKPDLSSERLATALAR